MFSTKKIIVIGVIILLTAGSYFGTESFFDSRLNKREIKKTVLRQLRAIFPNLAPDIDQIHLNLWQGVIIENVAISSEKDFNQGKYLLQIPQVVLGPTLFDRLQGETDLKTFRIVEPVMRTRTGDGEPIWNLIIKHLRKKSDQDYSGYLFSIEGGRIELGEDLAGDYQVQMDGNISLGDNSTGDLQLLLSVLENTDKRITQWEEIGQIRSTGKVAVIPKPKETKPAKKAKKKYGKAKKKKQKDPQPESGFTMTVNTTVDNVPLDLLLGIGQTYRSRLSKSATQGNVTMTWQGSVFKLDSKLTVEDFNYPLLGGHRIENLPLSLTAGYNHDTDAKEFKDLSISLTSPVFETKVTAPTITYNDKEVTKFTVTGNMKAGKLEDLEDFLTGDFEVAGSSEFTTTVAYDRFSYAEPLKVTAKVDIKDLRVHNADTEKDLVSSLNHNTDYKDGNVASTTGIKLNGSTIDLKSEGKINPIWIRMPKTYKLLLGVRQDITNTAAFNKVAFHKIWQDWPEFEKFIVERMKSKLTSGSIITFFRETEAYHQFFKPARQKWDIAVNNSSITNQKLPPISVTGTLSQTALNLNIESAPPAGDNLIKNSGLKGALLLNLISNKPTMVLNLNGTNWAKLKLVDQVLADASVDTMDFNLTTSSYGTTLAEFYNSADYRGQIKMSKVEMDGSPFHTALLVNKTGLEDYPGLKKNDITDFDQVDLRFRYTKHNGYFDVIQLESTDLKLQGRGSYARGRDSRIVLAGIINQTGGKKQFKLEYDIDPEGKIKKCKLN